VRANLLDVSKLEMNFWILPKLEVLFGGVFKFSGVGIAFFEFLYAFISIIVGKIIFLLGVVLPCCQIKVTKNFNFNIKKKIYENRKVASPT